MNLPLEASMLKLSSISIQVSLVSLSTRRDLPLPASAKYRSSWFWARFSTMAQTTLSFTQPKRGIYMSLSLVKWIQRRLPPLDLTTPILTSGFGSPTLGYFCLETEGCTGKKFTLDYLEPLFSSF